MNESQSPVAASAKVDLTRARALLLDDNQVHLSLLSNVLTSFDLRRQTKVGNLRDAKAAAGGSEFDLILVEAALANGAGFDFIRWLRREGPDRRFKAFGPPIGTKGRRHDDLNAKIGAAVEPNMSQNEIDLLMKPTRVKL
jgi:CheY-like chemotaxis protein